jgi:hypothetical protein
LIQSFSLLIHPLFIKQAHRVVSQYPPTQKESIEKQIATALQEIKSNPFSQKFLKDIKANRLVGNVRRIYVGGNSEHRLFYCCPSRKTYVLPVFISLERRKDFDYNNVQWEDIANTIYEDLINKNYDVFVKK